MAVRHVIRTRKKADREEAYRWRGPDDLQVIFGIGKRAVVVGDVAAPWVALPRRRGVWVNWDGRS